MFSGPAVTPVQAGAAQKKTLFYSVAGLACIGISLFLIVTTVVVALIPIYIADRSTAYSREQSKDVTVVVEIDRAQSGRRRRQTDELDSYIGSEAGPSLKSRLTQKVKSQMDSKLVSDVLVTQMTLAYKDDGRRKRQLLTKRAARRRVLYMKFRFYYQFGITLLQKINGGAKIRDKINTTFSTNFTLDKVDFYYNGVLIVLPVAIQLYQPTYIGLIVPESSSITVETSPTTGRPTITTSTTSTTITSTLTGGVPFVNTPPVTSPIGG